eukprot:CFRG0976T1
MSKPSAKQQAAIASLREACIETADEARAATVQSGQAKHVYDKNKKFPSRKAAMDAKIAAAKARRETEKK